MISHDKELSALLFDDDTLLFMLDKDELIDLQKFINFALSGE